MYYLEVLGGPPDQLQAPTGRWGQPGLHAGTSSLVLPCGYCLTPAGKQEAERKTNMWERRGQKLGEWHHRLTHSKGANIVYSMYIYV